ncbi:Alpha/Beta hydrolase protein [Podospora australis]|uniref:Alpha/Beta hydrolase protein n=1 Tax=Podospora australis TaxID=1536484 RepID=A0AAN7AFK2_9PEZI|nr:Alpha/Beta hydrolase protein [Podospora australis]
MKLISHLALWPLLDRLLVGSTVRANPLVIATPTSSTEPEALSSLPQSPPSFVPPLLVAEHQIPLIPLSHTSDDRSSIPTDHENDGQHSNTSSSSVSPAFFASLERMSRLVDITYCVGTTGVTPPFSCASRCRDFPKLHLVRTWNTGMLMSDSCGYIAVDHGEKEIVVAFRGTYSITNTIVDLSTVPQEYVPYPERPPPADGDGDGEDGDGEENKCANCTVHMGFMASWRQARDVVVPALKAAREKHLEYPVHLVGHSLGGAVAALAALELRVGKGWKDVRVTTFGEPRVGNKGLAQYLDRAFGLIKKGEKDQDKEAQLYRRVTHVGDPVPLLPLTEWGFRSHAGELFIEKSGLPPAPEDLRVCYGDNDPACLGGAETDSGAWIPARLKLWQLLFAHRDYFWRLGLCLPGGDPADWGREKYNLTDGTAYEMEELRDL